MCHEWYWKNTPPPHALTPIRKRAVCADGRHKQYHIAFKAVCTDGRHKQYHKAFTRGWSSTAASIGDVGTHTYGPILA